MSQDETKKKGARGALVFRYHIPNEPHSLDPTRLTSTDASYLFNNIMRGLYSYTRERGLAPEGAQSCRFETPLRMACELDKSVLWSDGSRVVAADYVRSFRRLLGTSGKNPSVDLLKNVKNAVAIHAGKMKATELGVREAGDDGLVFEFETHDPDFLFKLTTSNLVPIKSETFPQAHELAETASKVIVNGPYKIADWQKGRRIRLEENTRYRKGRPGRPPVEVLFIDDDQTALNLYEEGTLTFLRRLSVHHLPKYKGRPDFVNLLMARFDYLGFGPELKDQRDLRAALSYALDYKEMQKNIDSPGPPGCPGLADELLDRRRCVSFDLEKAKAHWAKVPEEWRRKRLQLAFSLLGGDGAKQTAEWFQAQWKRHLGITVDLMQMEQGTFLARLRANPPAIFRKGVGQERPTCLAALETFARGTAENYLRIDDDAYETIIDKLAKASPAFGLGRPYRPAAAARAACGEGIQYFLDRHLMIPLGQFAFPILARRKFEGWTLNEMNQLDLARLRASQAPGAPRPKSDPK